MPSTRRPQNNKPHARARSSRPGLGAPSAAPGATIHSDKYKIPIISMLFERRRKKQCLRGAAVLQEVNDLYRRIRARLDRDVRSQVETRLADLLAMVREIRTKPADTIVPEFVYVYIINPSRLEYAANQLLVDLKLTQSTLSSSSQSSSSSVLPIESGDQRNNNLSPKRKGKQRAETVPLIPGAEDYNPPSAPSSQEGLLTAGRGSLSPPNPPPAPRNQDGNSQHSFSSSADDMQASAGTRPARPTQDEFSQGSHDRSLSSRAGPTPHGQGQGSVHSPPPPRQIDYRPKLE